MGRYTNHSYHQQQCSFMVFCFLVVEVLPSSKLTQTLADRGWKTSFHKNIGHFQGPTVNLPEGNMFFNRVFTMFLYC